MSHASTGSKRSARPQTADEYLAKRNFGRLGKAKVDDSDDDPQDALLQNYTPVTRRKVKEEVTLKQIKKLGCFATFMTLMKGFVISSILYLPKSFVNGGYVFQTFMLLFSAVITIYSGLLLLDVRKRTNLTSYSDIGELTYGKCGRISVDIALWAS